MDGNGRWAKARGLTRTKGHETGLKAAQATYRHACTRGIKHLTLYAFSKENWSRPKAEVDFLFGLVVRFFSKEEIAYLRDNNIRLRILGELDGIPKPARDILAKQVEATAQNTSMTLNLALNYSSRAEILRAVQNLLAQGADPASLTEQDFADQLYTAGQPDPDLVIRTSGEHRLSNYLMYQAAYAELYFTDVLWPDFGPDQLDAALDDYACRQRRFGKTGDQLTK